MIIRQYLVPTDKAYKITSGTGNTRRKICIHETDNTKAGADADAHSRLQYRGNSRQASWHWQVDDQEAVQSFTHEWKCWAAGTVQGNNEAIHIEICVNSDGNYKQAVKNAAQLVSKIMKEEKLTINDVVQHNYYSGKNCPRIMRGGNNITWNQFLQMIKESEELTVGQYEELKNLINEQAKRIQILEAHFGLVERDVLGDHKEAWEWAVKEGLVNGKNPNRLLTREQMASILKRYYEKFIKNNQSN